MRLPSLCITLLLVGCAQQPPGFAIVNRSDQTLKDVKISPVQRDHDPITMSMKVMEPGASFSGPAFVGMIGNESVATWVDSTARRQRLASKVPPGFNGFACFEFNGDAWRFVPVKRNELDAFLRTPLP